MAVLHHFIDLFLAAAPWLLLGYLAAGVIKYLLPSTWLSRQLGGKGFLTTVKASFLGAPLPLCSCGVIPAALGLRRAGASKNATAAFLVATPETGVDSIAISYALLGPFMAIVRPIAAILSAITAGTLVALQPITASPSTPDPNSHPLSHEAGKARTPKLIVRFALGSLVRDTYRWLLIGILFAALVQAYLPADFLTRWGQGPVAMIVMALVGLPMYVCATASTPIAAGLLLAGVSPGAVLVFLLTGPATNLATLAIVRRELGSRSLVAYLAGVIVPAILFGLLTNQLVAAGLAHVEATTQPHAHPAAQFTTIAAAIILALAMLYAAARDLGFRIPSKTKPEPAPSPAPCPSCCAHSSLPEPKAVSIDRV